MSKTLVVVGVARDRRNPFGEWLNQFALLRRVHPHAANACSTDEELAIKFAEVVHAEKAITPALPQEVVVSRVLDSRIKLRLICSTGDGEPSAVVGCYAVVDGELVGLICADKGRGDWMLNLAESDGAERLDCFANQPLQRRLLRRGNWRLAKIEREDGPGNRAVLYWKRKKGTL